MLEHVEALFDAHATDGTLAMPYVTEFPRAAGLGKRNTLHRTRVCIEHVFPHDRLPPHPGFEPARRSVPAEARGRPRGAAPSRGAASSSSGP